MVITNKPKYSFVYPSGTEFVVDGLDDFGVKSWRVTTGPSEPRNGIVSYETPLGNALLSNRDSYIAPEGEYKFKVVSFSLPIEEIDNIDWGSVDLAQIRNLIKYALSDNFRSYVTQVLPSLDIDDFKLATCWAQIPEISKIDISAIGNIIALNRNYELGKMLSARAAEKGAVRFFNQVHHGEVQDISIKQISDPHEEEWKMYDILVDSQPYDVKNSRRTRLNENQYVEHTVPRFKEARNQTVKILGVLSHYLTPSEILFPDSAPLHHSPVIRILGETETGLVSKLSSFFESDNFKLEFSRPRRPGTFLPAWIFDFPLSYYDHRNEAICKIRVYQEKNTVLFERAGKQLMPIWIASGLEPPEEWQRTNLYRWQQRFIKRLFRSQSEFGLSLPVMFLTILTHFLDVVSGKEVLAEAFDPADYRQFVYFSYDQISNPLLIHDPLNTIASLVDVLRTLWNAGPNEICEYKSFRLNSAGILRGKTSNYPHPVRSLVAYCGGRIGNNWPCGNTPLVLGRHFHCPECGMLICDQCGFCAEKCSKCYNHTERFMEQNPHS